MTTLRKMTVEQRRMAYQAHRGWVSKNLEKRKAYMKAYYADPVNKERRKENYRKRIEHYRARDKAHYHLTKERHRELHIAKRYGMSVEAYRLLLENHGGLCGICGNPETAKNKTLSVDHNHRTGKVRGLLCGRCNKTIGFFHEDLELLEKAKKYLLLHDPETA